MVSDSQFVMILWTFCTLYEKFHCHILLL